MKNLIFVKLGGSLITHKSKPFTERPDIIKRLAREIHEAREELDIKIILGHGGGSYPHHPAKEYQVHKGVTSPESLKGAALVQDAAARLNRIVVKALVNAGENAFSINPSSCTISASSQIKEWYTKPLEVLLEHNMLPVVYGDVGIDTEQGFCILSTEELFFYLSQIFNPDKIIMCGKTDGVFTGDPNKDSSVRHIPEITNENFSHIKNYLTNSDGIDVTGGMILKVKKSLELANRGITTHILNGEKEGLLKNALLGHNVKCTIIRK